MEWIGEGPGNLWTNGSSCGGGGGVGTVSSASRKVEGEGVVTVGNSIYVIKPHPPPVVSLKQNKRSKMILRR